MKGEVIIRFPLIVTCFLFLTYGQAQGWEFAKERDGIRVYTKKEAGSELKSFKGETILHTRISKVTHLVGNGDNFDWWADGIRELRVLAYEKNKFIRYYLIYDLPWPLSDRDLCVEALINDDPVSGRRIVSATPLPDVIPEEKDLVRIKKYYQKWIITPVGQDKVHVILEGFVDPAGSVPAWLYNMVITETPLKVIRNVKDRVE